MAVEGRPARAIYPISYTAFHRNVMQIRFDGLCRPGRGTVSHALHRARTQADRQAQEGTLELTSAASASHSRTHTYFLLGMLLLIPNRDFLSNLLG